MITRALQMRSASPGLFLDGSYVPLAIEGPAADHVIGLARVYEGRALLTFVSRLPAKLAVAVEHPLPGEDAWRGTAAIIPRNLVGRRTIDVLGGQDSPGWELAGKLPIADVLTTLPVALLEVR